MYVIQYTDGKTDVAKERPEDSSIIAFIFWCRSELEAIKFSNSIERRVSR